MNDKKSDDDFFEEDFNEEFDFGEDNFDVPASANIPEALSNKGDKGSSKKPLLAGILLLIIGGLGYFGYQYYESKPKTETRPLIAQVPSKSVQSVKPVEPKTAPTAPKELHPASNAKKQVKSTPTPSPLISETTGTTPHLATQTAKPETKAETPQVPVFNEKDLEQFMTTSEPGTTEQKTSTVPPIAPEKAAETTATAAAPTTGATTSIEKTPSTAAATIVVPSTIEPMMVTPAVPADTPPVTPVTPVIVSEAPKEVLLLKETPPNVIVSQPPSIPSTVLLKQLPTIEPVNTIQEMQKDLFSEAKTPPTLPPSMLSLTPTVEAPPVKDIKDQIKEAMDALSKLNHQMENNLTQIKNLDVYTKDVSHTVSKLNSDISAMDNRLLALTNAATSLSKDIGTVRNEVGSVRQNLREDTLDVSTAPRRSRIEAPTVLIEEPEYVVHAVIPGRAWLKSAKGQILTVSEGDSVGNYGKVLVIDAANGVVLTSSGITFR